MDATDYVLSTNYEFFIRSACNCERDDDKYGAHNQYMLNLMYKEKDSTAVSNMKHSKLLANVKDYMISAINFALKRKISKVDKELLKSYINIIEKSTTSQELLDICQKGTELFLTYKPSSDSI